MHKDVLPFKQPKAAYFSQRRKRCICVTWLANKAMSTELTSWLGDQD